MGESAATFAAGSNIAMKVPPHLFDDMVAFYRDTLGLEATPDGTSVRIAFGAVTLWLDNVPTATQPELWLEVEASDTAAAADRLAADAVPRCDAVEPLPEGFDGFWVSAPGGVIHLVKGRRR